MDLKYLAHCTATTSKTFKHGNWRGEPRWESNAVDALLSEGETVHTTTDVWQSVYTKPSNLFAMNHKWMDHSVQISYGVPHEIHTGTYPVSADPKYRIVQYQDGPSVKTKDKFLQHDRKLAGSIVATCSFMSGQYLSRLKNVLGAQNVVWTYGPTVPQVFTEHAAFEQNNMLWAYRNFCAYAQRDPGGMTKLFGIVAGYLKDNPAARLVMLIQPHTHEQSLKIAADCRGFFFNHGFAKQLEAYSSQIDVHTALDWLDVLSIMSKTKLIISPAEPLGGPPFEAGSYGIPTVLEARTNPFMAENGSPLFSKVLTAQQGLSNPFFNNLQKLNNNRTFYEQHGDAYRSFIDRHATYKAYVQKLKEIASQRGWSA